MKKILLIFLILSLQKANAQFFRGVGIFGAVNHSCHYYKNGDADKRTLDPLDFNSSTYTYYYPRNHISREYFSWGAGIFAELLPYDRVRWQTEFEFTHKGAKEKELLDPFVGTRSSGFSVNKYTYIQWNNYLKFYNPIGLSSHWYLLAGIKLEYLFSQSVSAYNAYAGSLPKIFFSGDVGLGYEFPLFKNFYGFTEYHWNPDILSHKKDAVRYRNRTFEFKVGIMYRPRKRSIDDCNAPRYNGPAY
jgi:hypothetical protein